MPGLLRIHPRRTICTNSYADIAAKNRLPESQQPHPDQGLLEGDHHDPNDLSHSTSSDEKIHGKRRQLDCSCR